MVWLIGIPTILLAAMLQTAVVSRITLLSGQVDLLMLVVLCWVVQERVRSVWEWPLAAGILLGYISELPVLLTVAMYLLAAGAARLIKNWVWQAPVLLLFTTVFVSTLLFQLLSFLYIQLRGAAIDPLQAFNQVTLPSVLLNLLLALPVYAVISETAHWVIRAPFEE